MANDLDKNIAYKMQTGAEPEEHSPQSVLKPESLSDQCQYSPKLEDFSRLLGGERSFRSP
jgi:hypothetical protein